MRFVRVIEVRTLVQSPDDVQGFFGQCFGISSSIAGGSSAGSGAGASST
jgi:hypothetical protein